MKNKPILIISGEPKSVFFEIFFKSLKKNSFKSPLILIASRKILSSEINKFGFKKKINSLDLNLLKKKELKNNYIYLIDVDYHSKNKPKKITNYIDECFNIAFKILKSGFTDKFINGPVDKSKFLNKRYLGVTEYISAKFKTDKTAMLIYNKQLSVCPATTHLPLKLVSKKITKKLIKDKVILIDNFYKKKIGRKVKIAITGLNPHCESILKFNEDEKIVKPAINFLKKRGYKVNGPFSADTIFLKQNRNKYDVILGMYHDQVLSPMKTLKEYDAINITLGLPFLRISPDHGPNKKMINKNLSNPLSLTKAIKFLDTR